MLQVYDVAIIGAGASGLMAAWELALAGRKVLVLEARERPGGRIFTQSSAVYPHEVEMGAEFMHGELPVTSWLLKKAGIDFFEVDGEIWQKRKQHLFQQEDFIEDYKELEKKLEAVKEDLPVHEFIDRNFQDEKWKELRFSLFKYITGYHAADPEKASTLALRKEFTSGNEKQFRIRGGYGRMIAFLQEQCIEKGVTIIYRETVTQIIHHNRPLTIATSHKTYTAEKVLVTIPLSLLQQQTIRFDPALPAKTKAASQLGFGSVIKIMVLFREVFWPAITSEDLSKAGYFFSDEAVPVWWTQYPEQLPMLTGWIGGPPAEQHQDKSTRDLEVMAITSLASLFGVEVGFIRQQLMEIRVANWLEEIYSCGAYSFDVVNGDHHKAILAAPVDDKIFFAGEALHETGETGTVEAALVTGRDTARAIIAGKA